MTRKEIYDFVKRHKLAVLATVSTSNVPEAALVGIAATEQLELIFDTVTSSRKYGNLRTNPNIAFVIGWDDEITLQYEGIAEEIRGKDLPAWKEIYFQNMARWTRTRKVARDCLLQGASQMDPL